MRRKTIFVDEDVLRKLREIARRENITLSEAIRAALARHQPAYLSPFRTCGTPSSSSIAMRPRESGSSTPASWRRPSA